MKLNGKSNVITDVDITLTNTKHIGESLHSVIEETDERLDKLESNIKWVYENGGVGSGSGGGGGSSTKWYIRATLGGIALESNSTVPLSNGAGTYTLRLYTSGGSGDYSVSYTVGKNPTRTVKLNADNGWAVNVSLDLQENGIIEIIAKDGIITREITGVSYVVIPYAFSVPALYRRDGSQYASSSGDIGVNIAQRNGIVLKAPYIIATPAQLCEYKWYQNGVEIQDAGGTIDDASGEIVYEIPRSLIENDNAGLYTYQLVVSLLPVGAVEPVIISNSCSFNLIPETLYLKISPTNSGEVIYTSDDIEDPYYFATNTKIALNVRIYKGLSSQNLSGWVRWEVNGEDPNTYDGNGSLNVTDGYTYKITTHFLNPGVNKVTFYYALNGEQGTPIEKYFYCKEVSTSYNWFFQTDTSNNNPETRRYYIPSETSGTTKLYGITGVSESALYIEKKKSDESDTILTVVENYDDSQYTGDNQILNFGIQYNDINNTANPLITCYDITGSEAITIYQNKIVFGGQFSQSPLDCNVFFHKEVDYDPENPKKYHLLTINVATCYQADNNYYYEITTYLDGKIEGTVNTKTIASARINIVALHNSNFSLNHFEISSWGTSDIRRVYDIDVNWYYNSYADRIGLSIDSEETEILTQMFDTSGVQSKPNYDMNNRLIKVDAGMPENIAGKIDVPVMVITCNKDIIYQGAKTDIFTWMNTSYTDGQVGLNSVTLDVQKLEWCPGINKELKEVKLEGENEEVLGSFTLDLQGSSTMTNKAKNFTLAVEPSESIASQNKAVLFSPNFVSDEASTFLPERAFTLKADDVDSSHSNNTAVGKFVNENNNWNYRNMIDLIGVEDAIKSHIKQCLEGFAMLLFLQVKYREGNTDYNDYYYLGIYNFNLGRNSYFNLGYTDLKQLSSVELDESALDHNGFALCVASVEPVAGFVAAEIQDNSPYWDFSQYDPSILFPLNDTESSGFMFGDFVYAPNTESVSTGTMQNLVKNVAGAGGYLFNAIEKIPIPCDELLPGEDKNQRAYHDATITHDPVTNKDVVTTYVSDVTQQYVRTRDENGNHYTPHTSSEIDVTSVGNLIQCIIDDSENDYRAPLDYPSLVYYYTTCMALGLVDSVEKNLNIKTWSAAPNGNNSKCGLFFYDMDTALGKDNSGAKTSYFAFSDYWKSNITRYDSSGNIIPDDDTVTEAVRIVNNGITNFRDTFLFDSGVKGYDTPSSFLFAIAKYAYHVNSEVRDNFNLMFPQQIYAQWRTLNGPLSSADNFIEKYFASNLKDVPGFLINLNYRNKYLYDYDEQKNTFGHSDRLHGIGVEETRDWLRGRLRILDAYFNVNKVNINITTTIPEKQNEVTLTDNPDVYLFSDIFSNGTTGLQRNQDMRFTVTAPDYSPLVARYGNDYKWYIFEDSNIAYETYVPSNGTQYIILGGSQLWRTLDSIDSFVISKTDPNSSFIFDSNIIEHMIGSSGTQTGNWVVNGPSLEEISLTSSNYSGTLALNNSFYSLNSVNISNSKISLSARECPIKTVIARNVKGNANVEIVNCSNLQSVDLTGATLQKCEIRPAWTDNINFSSVYAKNVILESKTPGAFTAKSNASLTDVTLTNFETINIDNCSNLKSVQCNDESAVVKKMTVTSCPSLTKLVLIADNLEELNLSGCTALKEITLNGASFNKLKILGLGNTQVSKMTIGGTVYDNGNLDLTMFPLLSKSTSGSYVSFYSNPGVISIKFDNSSDTYLRVDTNISSSAAPFYNCSNLERIYGSFIIMCNDCFYRCGKFSIHGSDLTQVTWKGQSVLNGQKVKHPLDFAGIRTINDYWPRTANITNMRFGGNYARNAFRETNCTIFDIYYMLFGCNNLLTSLSETFFELKNYTYGEFNWTNLADNSPDRRMFNNCSNVQSMSQTFYRTGTGGSKSIRLFSPSTNPIITSDPDPYARSVIADDGLFSPLVNLTSYSRVFLGYTTYIDRFVWQRSQLSTYNKLKTINGFSAQYIVNQNINTLNYNNRAGLSYSEYGNLTDFFKCIPKLSDAVYGLFNTTRTIDYDTVSGIPDKITALWRCFRSTGGRGTIDLNRMFSSSSDLTSILHSFIAVGSSTTTVESPLLELTDNTFTNLTKLTRIGYSDNSSNYPSDSELTTRYSFSGIVRKSYGNEFPFDIFANHPDLTMACGIFMNATGSVPNLQLPGRLFENNSKLEECSALFYNLNNGTNKYSISETHPISYTKDSGNATKIVAVIDPSSGSPNFTNCSNLRRVDYMFASPSGNTFPQLTGMIPRNLFWHGLDVASKIVTIRGTNTRILHEEDTTYYEYIEEDPIEQWQIVPSATITDINNCFQHCDCSPYVNMNPEYEKNPNYSPFLYVYENNRWKENTKRDTFENTYIWSYDGYNDYSNVWSNSEVLDFVDWNRENIFEARTASYSQEHDVLPSAQRTFICPPDLLRFCTKSARIQGLFAYSGTTGMNTTYHNESLYNYGGKYAFGLKGRICPYLLKPVSDTTNVSAMFAYCKCLSYIRDYEDNVDYMLPETFFSYTKNVSNLRSLFSYTIQPHLITLRNCFKPLIQPLELNNIFYRCYWSGSDTSKTLISEVFRTNQLKSVVEAFAMSDNNQDGYPRSQYITFENIFPSSYAAARYASDSNFSRAFFGYSSSSYVTHEDPKTLPDNIETKNYTYV